MQTPFGFSQYEEAMKFVSDNNIKIVNLCHVPEDGRLKMLSFSVVDKDRLSEILDFGERVDGSSLFSFIEPGQSDIYIKPRISRAFVNPFAALSTLSIMCDYLDEKGNLLNVAPSNVLKKAEEKFHRLNGIELRAMCELEFYMMSKLEPNMAFNGVTDKNYHDSAPFSRFQGVRDEMMAVLAHIGIATKYGHSEAGRFLTEDNVLFEQHEIEFIPKEMGEMAETVTLAKWVIRNVCLNHGLSVSFSPKVAWEHAGSGMHIHTGAVKNGESILSDDTGALSDYALEMIGGLLKFAPSLAAFGNPVPVSYLRFISAHESPMSICWGKRNRLALIRIPLWWDYRKDKDASSRKTFEYRAPDAFANPYLILAALAIAAIDGLQNPKEGLQTAQDSHADVTDVQGRFKALPCSCNESAHNLMRDRQYYEADEVFPKRLIDKTVEKLLSYDDSKLWKRLGEKPHGVDSLLKQYLNYG